MTNAGRDKWSNNIEAKIDNSLPICPPVLQNLLPQTRARAGGTERLVELFERPWVPASESNRPLQLQSDTLSEIFLFNVKGSTEHWHERFRVAINTAQVRDNCRNFNVSVRSRHTRSDKLFVERCHNRMVVRACVKPGSQFRQSVSRRFGRILQAANLRQLVDQQYEIGVLVLPPACQGFVLASDDIAFSPHFLGPRCTCKILEGHSAELRAFRTK
mmetsp:Transcript_17843/g.35859  ORF Transcript_17843/g.35859 Transcript_17843/m.35859 type:complete len:216 (+) Transcript_17843:1950-2597(+)